MSSPVRNGFPCIGGVQKCAAKYFFLKNAIPEEAQLYPWAIQNGKMAEYAESHCGSVKSKVLTTEQVQCLIHFNHLSIEYKVHS